MDQRVVRINRPILGDGIFDSDIDDTAILPRAMGCLLNVENLPAIAKKMPCSTMALMRALRPAHSPPLVRRPSRIAPIFPRSH
jgi:hypothetical protein